MLLAAFVVFVSANSWKTKEVKMWDYDGLVVFVDCEPIGDFETIAKDKVGVSFLANVDYRALRKMTIKEVKKKYPNANGIIVDMVTLHKLNYRAVKL